MMRCFQIYQFVLSHFLTDGHPKKKKSFKYVLIHMMMIRCSKSMFFIISSVSPLPWLSFATKNKKSSHNYVFIHMMMMRCSKSVFFIISSASPLPWLHTYTYGCHSYLHIWLSFIPTHMAVIHTYTYGCHSRQKQEII